FCFLYQAEDGIRVFHVTGVQTCALPISATSSTGPDASTKCVPRWLPARERRATWSRSCTRTWTDRCGRRPSRRCRPPWSTSAGAATQPLDVEHDHRPLLQTQPATSDEVGQRLVHRLARGADQLGQLLLREVVHDANSLVGGHAEPGGQVEQLLGDPSRNVGE